MVLGTVEYAWKKGEHPKRGEFSPDFFIRKGNTVYVVEVKEEGTEYVFSVRDNGIGIAEEHYDRIFVIFQRLNRAEEYQGTGAGLTIVRKIVERNGGRIWLRSVVGEGTTFFFTVPK